MVKIGGSEAGDDGEDSSGKPSQEEMIQAYKLIDQSRSRAPHLLAYLNDHPAINANIYAIKQRIKTFRGILEKVERRRKTENPDFGVADVTDALGIRFVTLYKRDMLRVLDILCGLVNRDGKPSAKEFPFARVRKVIIYDSESRVGNDHNVAYSQLCMDAKAIVAQKFDGVDCSILPRDQYSSIHLVVDLPPQGNYGDNDDLPIEIQIRTIFEDAWGQIDHALKYQKERDRTESERARDSDGRLKARLAMLKSMLDTAAQFADQISDDEEESRAQRVDSLPVKASLGGEGHFPGVLERAGVDRATIEEFSNLVKRKHILDEAGDGDGKRQKYVALANDFQASYSRFLAGQSNRPNDSERASDKSPAVLAPKYGYKMEEALCRLLSATEGEVEKAIGIYEQLRAEFGKSLALRFRLGQALMAVKRDEKALEEFKEAEQLAYADFSDDITALPEEDLTYIRVNYPREIGLINYHRANGHAERGETAEQLRCLVNAYDASSKVDPAEVAKLSEKKSRIKLMNVLLFYVTQYYEMAHTSKGPLPAQLRFTLQDVTTKLNEFLVEVDSNKDDVDVNFIDTIAYAHCVQKNYEQARIAAERAIKVLWEPRNDNVVDSETRVRMMRRLSNIRSGRPPSQGIWNSDK